MVKQCEICGKEFEVNCYTPNKKTCSAECGKIQLRARMRNELCQHRQKRQQQAHSRWIQGLRDWVAAADKRLGFEPDAKITALIDSWV